MVSDHMKSARAARPASIALLTAIVLGGILLGSACGTYIKIPVVSRIPREYMELMKGGRKIALVAVASRGLNLNNYGDWAGGLQGVQERTLRRYGYFQLLDLGGRDSRLREIAYSQTGLTDEQKEIGQELAADGFFFIEIPRQPAYDCKKYETFKTKTSCTKRGKIVRNNVEQYVCTEKKTVLVKSTYYVTTLTVFLKGRLVNTETAQSISPTHAEPIYQRGDSCVSYGRMFASAAESASESIARALSPLVSKLDVPLDDKPVGVPESAAAAVEKLLEEGVGLADDSQFKLARDKWKEALQRSAQSSANAFWNLAVYYWYAGDMQAAEDHFRRAERLGGIEYMDKSKMNVYSRFLHEQKRRETEISNEE